jgi:hypothetical protein
LGEIVFVRRPLAQYRQHEMNTFGAYPDARARVLRLARGESFLRPAAAAAANRAMLLRQIAGDVPPQWRERVQQGIAYYGALEKRLDGRAEVYASPSLGTRIAALRRLLRDGAYAGARGSGRFGWIELLKDIYLAVPFGPRLRRFLP